MRWKIEDKQSSWFYREIGSDLQLSRIAFAFDRMSIKRMRVVLNSIKVAIKQIEYKRVFGNSVRVYLLGFFKIYNLLHIFLSKCTGRYIELLWTTFFCRNIYKYLFY